MFLSKRLFNILAIPLVAILFSMVATKPANAAEFHFKDYTLAQDETITDNIYITNNYTEINGLVQGDLMIVATDVKITGTITGDIYAIGSNITFTGNTYGSIYLIGNEISVQGISKGNAYTIGNTVNFNGNVEKDYANISAKSNITGSIGDDARFIMAEGTIDSLIQGDAFVLGNSYSLREDKVTGEIYNETRLKVIAQEQGVDLSAEEKSVTFNWTDKLFGALFAFCSMSLVGYFMIAAAPVKTGKIIAKVTDSPKDAIISFALGTGILVVAPIAMLLLLISLVGAPLALFVAGILIFLTFFGRLWVETAIGQEVLVLFKVSEYRPFKALAIGRAISVLIGLIPIVGSIYSFIIMSTAVGSFTRMKIDYWKKGKKK